MTAAIPEKFQGLGTWSVALAVDPPRPEAIADRIFLKTLSAANPRYTGWPIWLDSSEFASGAARPRQIDNGWEALIVLEEALFSSHVEFMRFDPTGKFYLLRVLQDDLTDKIKPGTALDPLIAILRVAEAIAVGLSFVKELEWELESTTLQFDFEWTKLRGRSLSTWGSPEVVFFRSEMANDETAHSSIDVPGDTPLTSSALSPLVAAATARLFAVFDGYTMPIQSIDPWVEKLLDRRL